MESARGPNFPYKKKQQSKIECVMDFLVFFFSLLLVMSPLTFQVEAMTFGGSYAGDRPDFSITATTWDRMAFASSKGTIGNATVCFRNYPGG